MTTTDSTAPETTPDAGSGLLGAFAPPSSAGDAPPEEAEAPQTDAAVSSDGRRLVRNRRLPRKESFHVMVANPDGTVQFYDATHDIGQKMRFSKPRATCAVRVYDDVVTFSMLLLAKRKAGNLSSKRVEIPHSALSRLARRAKHLATPTTETKTAADGSTTDVEVPAALATSSKVVVEIDSKEYVCNLVRNDSGVASIEMPDGEDDVVFELGRTETKLSIYLKSPRVDRVLALSFIGFLGKGETPMSVCRAASMAMAAALNLSQFQGLAGIENVEIPPLPGTAFTRALSNLGNATFEIHTGFFTDDNPPQLVGEGKMVVEIDLEHANTQTGTLLFKKVTTDDEITPLYGHIQEHVHRSLNMVLRQILGDELARIALDIVLGEVDAGLVERLTDATGQLVRVDFTPTQFNKVLKD